MSKQQTIKAIKRELDRVNQDIDLKIIRGVPYAREARRHKILMSQLSRLAPARSLFGFSLASAFMF